MPFSINIMFRLQDVTPQQMSLESIRRSKRGVGETKQRKERKETKRKRRETARRVRSVSDVQRTSSFCFPSLKGFLSTPCGENYPKEDREATVLLLRCVCCAVLCCDVVC